MHAPSATPRPLTREEVRAGLPGEFYQCFAVTSPPQLIDLDCVVLPLLATSISLAATLEAALSTPDVIDDPTMLHGTAKLLRGCLDTVETVLATWLHATTAEKGAE